MLKKLNYFLCFAMILGLAACGGSSNDTTVDDTPKEPIGEQFVVESNYGGKSIEFSVPYAKANVIQNGTSSIGSAVVVVKVINTGDTIIDMHDLRSFKYELIDEYGNVHTSYFSGSCPTMIRPNEMGYLSNLTYLDEKFDRTGDIKVELLFDTESITTLNDNEEVYQIHEVMDVEIFKNDLGNMAAKGKVKNNTDSNVDDVYVNITLLDKDNNPLCILVGTTDIKAGETVGFEALATTYNLYEENDVASYKAEAMNFR